MEHFAFKAHTRQRAQATVTTTWKQAVYEDHDVGTHFIPHDIQLIKRASTIAHCIHHSTEIALWVVVDKPIKNGSEPDQRSAVGVVTIGNFDELINLGFRLNTANRIQEAR